MIQAAGMTSIYTIGSICAVLFWAFMMAKLKMESAEGCTY